MRTSILLALFIPVFAFTQYTGQPFDSISSPPIVVTSSSADTVYPPRINYYQAQQFPYNHKRIKLAAAGNIIGYGGTMAALYSTWYKNYPQSNFHFFNDNHEWLQVDKVGHAYSAYIESYGSSEIWRWTGINRKSRILLGALSGAGYQTVIETLDGFSAEWGWSWGDFTANVFGSGLWALQEIAWDEQRIRFKYSFHKKNYGSQQLNMRANELFGKNTSQRLLKDYNAQTYWLTANLKSILPKSNLPSWLSIAVGYGAEGMFGAEQNIKINENGVTTFYRPDIKRYRQWYLAPDIDFTKIKTKNKTLKFVLGVLNAFKFPAPSLEFSNRKIRWNWIHF